MTQFNYDFFFFILFASIALTSAIFVIYSKNTVYSVFFLILVFTGISGLLLIAEVEFLAIILIVIYVGAITVLFVFIVMMLDIDKENKKGKNDNYIYLPIIFFISVIFFIQFYLLYSKSFTSYQSFIYNNLEMGTYSVLCEDWALRYSPKYINVPFIYNRYILNLDSITNTETLGQILYTYYSFFLLTAGLILLIALMGAVTLTILENKKFLTKNLYQQLSRNFLNAIYKIKKKDKK